MQRSSDLVMRLNGNEPIPDTADDAYEMVFGRSEGAAQSPELSMSGGKLSSAELEMSLYCCTV